MGSPRSGDQSFQLSRFIAFIRKARYTGLAVTAHVSIKML